MTGVRRTCSFAKICNIASPVHHLSEAGPYGTTRINPFHAMTFPSGQSPVIEFDNPTKHLGSKETSSGRQGPLKRMLSASATADAPVDDEPTLSPQDQISHGIDPMLTFPGQSKLVPAVHIKRVSKDVVELVPASEVSARISPNGGDVQHVGMKDKLLGKVGRAFGFGHDAADVANEDVGASRGLGAVVGNGNSTGRVTGPDFSPQPIGGDESREVGGALPPSPPISEHELDPLHRPIGPSETDAVARRSRTATIPHALLMGEHGATSFTDEPEAMTPVAPTGAGLASHDGQVVEAPITLAPPISLDPVESSADADAPLSHSSVPAPAAAPTIASLTGWTGPIRSGSIAAVKKRTPSTAAPVSAGLQAVQNHGPTRRASATVAEQASQASPSMVSQALPRTSFSSTTSTLGPPPQAIRRNTFTNTPGAPSYGSTSNGRMPLTHSVSQSDIAAGPSSSRRQQVEVPGLDGSALDWDIVAETERLRRERLSRRQKKKTPPEIDVSPEMGLAQDDQALPLPPPPRIVDAQASPKAGQRKMSEREQGQERVLVGNLIGEDHVNFVLMYNMLTGIRIGVSPSDARMVRTFS